MVNWQLILRSRCAGAVVSLILHTILMVALAAFLMVDWGEGPEIDVEIVGLSSSTSSLEAAFDNPSWTSPATEFSRTSTLTARSDVRVTTPGSLNLGNSFWQTRSQQIAGIGDQVVLPNESSAPGAQFFGVAAQGTRFVYVVDCSTSMRGGRWHAAREELVRSLQDLEEDVSFLVVFFSDDAIPMPGSAMQLATPENIEFAANWIRSATVVGGTKPLSSIVLAHDEEPDAIFLLTDGEFADGTARFLRSKNAKKGPEMASVHTIAFHSRAGIRLLQRIAKENSGQFRYVPPGLAPGSGPISTRIVP